MEFIPFEAWYEQNDDIRKELIRDGVECPECDGEGVIECGECSNEKDCEDCENGYITEPGEHAVKHAMRNIYEIQKLLDAKKFKEWQGFTQELRDVSA